MIGPQENAVSLIPIQCSYSLLRAYYPGFITVQTIKHIVATFYFLAKNPDRPANGVSTGITSILPIVRETHLDSLPFLQSSRARWLGLCTDSWSHSVLSRIPPVSGCGNRGLPLFHWIMAALVTSTCDDAREYDGACQQQTIVQFISAIDTSLSASQ